MRVNIDDGMEFYKVCEVDQVDKLDGFEFRNSLFFSRQERLE